MHLKLRAIYLRLQAFCKASSGFRLHLFALKMFHSLKSVTWLDGCIKSMPKMCSSCLQRALAKGCGALQKTGLHIYIYPYAGPSNPFFSLSLQLLWKTLGNLKLPFRHQKRSLACSYLAIFPSLLTWSPPLPFLPLSSALLPELLLLSGSLSP